MKTKKLLMFAVAVPGLAVLVGSANAASSTVTTAAATTVTFTDLVVPGMFDSLTTPPAAGGDGSLATRGAFRVDVLGPMACLRVTGMDTVGNTTGAPFYTNTVALDISIRNLQGYAWKNLTVELFADDSCSVPSDDPDQWNFGQGLPAPWRDPATSVGSTFISDEDDLASPPPSDRIIFDFDSLGNSIPHGGSVGSTFILANGSIIGPGLSGVLSMKIAPEPSSMALLGLGALGLFFRRRRA